MLNFAILKQSSEFSQQTPLLFLLFSNSSFSIIPEERKTTHTTHSDIPIAIDLKRKEIGANKSILQKIKEAVFPSQF